MMSRIAAVLLLMSCAPIALAQQYGQWSWEGSVAATQRKYTEATRTARQTIADQRDINLSLAIHGFLLHPALGSFRLGVDSTASRDASGLGLKTNRLGYRGDVNILPQSLFPVRLYAARQHYAYAMNIDDPYLLYSAPDSSSSHGGALRVRGGPLSGLIAASDRTTISFLGGQQSQTIAGDHLDWSRASSALQQHYRLERQNRDYGAGARLNDLMLNADEHASFPRWRWDMTAVALQRSFGPAQGSRTDLVRIQNHLASVPRNGHVWDLSLESGYSGSDRDGVVQTHDLTGRYLHDPVAGWQIVPFAGYGVQLSDGTTVTTPRVGLSANWSATRRGVDLSANSAASGMLLQSIGKEASINQTQISWSLGGSAAQGSLESLRKDLLVSVSRNQLRSAGETFSQVPVLGFGLAGAGTEDVQQARLTVQRRLQDSLLLTAYSDASSRRSSLSIASTGYTATSLTNTVQLTARNIGILLNEGSAMVRSTTTQRIRFLSGSAAWRPLPLVSMNVLYRKDRRQTMYEPDLDGQRLEVGATIRIGAFYLTPRIFRVRERLRSGDERASNGFTMSITRQFGGWLPVVSGYQRRGVVK